jgi:23S rRNA (guanosine2251-2'-O)-methyltransferase
MEGEIIAGVHPVLEAVLSQKRVIERIHVVRGAVNDKLRRVLDEARVREIPIRKEAREALDRLAGANVHQGIVAVAGARGYARLEDLVAHGGGSPALFVVLDEVQDPHNLGAVIRTAETAGATGVVVTERHSAPLSAAVARASAGALEHLPVARVGNLVNCIKYLKTNGIWIVGLESEAETPWTGFDYSVPVALVLGGEHRGIRRLVREHCDVLVGLPVRGRVASLNVSVSAGIALYEVVRQRMAAPGRSG